MKKIAINIFLLVILSTTLIFMTNSKFEAKAIFTQTVQWYTQTDETSHYKLYSHFSDEGSYDCLHSHAKSKDGTDAQASSKDGGGQWVNGNWALNTGDISWADQGAQRGSDHAYMYH